YGSGCRGPVRAPGEQRRDSLRTSGEQRSAPVELPVALLDPDGTAGRAQLGGVVVGGGPPVRPVGPVLVLAFGPEECDVVVPVGDPVAVPVRRRFAPSPLGRPPVGHVF